MVLFPKKQSLYCDIAGLQKNIIALDHIPPGYTSIFCPITRYSNGIEMSPDWSWSKLYELNGNWTGPVPTKLNNVHSKDFIVVVKPFEY